MKYFKSGSILSLIVLFLFVGLISCKTGKSAAQQYKPLENSLLWKISGQGIKNPSFLFGTIHIIQSKDFFLPKGTMSALDQTKKIVFEIDMKEVSDISAMMGIMNKVFMKDNHTLKDFMTEEDYTMVGKHFQKMGLPLFILERMKPMFLTVFAYGDMDPSGLKNGNMKSYEMELLEMAKNSGKETGGLETIDFQIGIFDEIPYDVQAKMLVDAIRASSVSENDEFKKMTDLYLSENINAMVNMISEEGSEVVGYEDKLLNERNKNWIAQIIQACKTEPTFFAVGAGHLAGPEGVINLLRKQGMQVTPVK